MAVVIHERINQLEAHWLLENYKFEDFVSKLERNVERESSLLTECNNFVVSSAIDFWNVEIDSWSRL
jgi:hypothetical protein